APDRGPGSSRAKLSLRTVMARSSFTMQARRFDWPSTSTRQSWQTPMPQKTLRPAPVRVARKFRTPAAINAAARLSPRRPVNSRPSNVKEIDSLIGSGACAGGWTEEALEVCARLVDCRTVANEWEDVSMPELLSGRVAVVTGGCRGIGRAIVGCFAEHGSTGLAGGPAGGATSAAPAPGYVPPVAPRSEKKPDPAAFSPGGAPVRPVANAGAH